MYRTSARPNETYRWQADTKRERFRDTFAAALAAHADRFIQRVPGAATAALVPIGMATQLGEHVRKICPTTREIC